MTTGTEPGPAAASPASKVGVASVADIAVVIVNWNARQEVVDCLLSLRSNPPSVPWEAVVVDNGSTDGSLGAIRQAAPWARIIANGTNLGLAAANNQGIRATRA